MNRRLFLGWAFLTLSAFVFSLPHALAAEKNSGPTYSAEQILNFDLAGLRLGMTTEEAGAAMKAAGYEGKFQNEISDSVTGWQQVDRAVFPFRYIAKDGKARLWYVQFKQAFDVNMSEEVLKEKIIQKYGQPTRIKNKELIYEDAWEFDRTSAESCLYFGASNCRMSTIANNPYKTFDELKAAFERAIQRPTLRIEIQPKQIVAHLENHGVKVESAAYYKQKADAAEEDKRRKASKKLDLGL